MTKISWWSVYIVQELDKMDMIVVPINISNSHWILVVVYPKLKEIK